SSGRMNSCAKVNELEGPPKGSRGHRRAQCFLLAVGSSTGSPQIHILSRSAAERFQPPDSAVPCAVAFPRLATHRESPNTGTVLADSTTRPPDRTPGSGKH